MLPVTTQKPSNKTFTSMKKKDITPSSKRTSQPSFVNVKSLQSENSMTIDENESINQLFGTIPGEK